MTSQPASTRTAKAIQFYYITVPRHLLLDLRDNPLAIGIYALMMRLVTATKAPLLISAGDILSYDRPGGGSAACRARGRTMPTPAGRAM